MNEREWFHETDPQGLLEFIGHRMSARKVRLFTIACCQTLFSFMNSLQRRALHIAENYADGWASDKDLRESLQSLLLNKGSSHEDGQKLAQEDLARALHVALFSEKLMDWYTSPEMLRDVQGLTPYSRKAFSSPFNYAIMTSIYLAQAMASIAKAGYGTPAQEDILRTAFDLHARILRHVVGNPFSDAAEKVATISRERPHLRLFAARIYLTTSFYDVPILARLIIEEGLMSSQIVDATQEDLGYVKGFWLVDAAAGLDWVSR